MKTGRSVAIICIVMSFLLPFQIATPSEVKSMPYLGIKVTPLSIAVLPHYEKFPVKEGLYVEYIFSDSPAKKAGLRVGQVITEVDGINVTTTEQLTEYIAQCSVGQEIKLKVYGRKTGSSSTSRKKKKGRSQTSKVISVTLIESPLTAYEVMGNTKSKLYHLTSCSHLPPENERIVFKNRLTAESEGFKPCKICFPETSPLVFTSRLEKELGKQAAGYLEYYYRVVYDDELVAHINNLGHKVAEVSERPEIDWRFSILDTQEINAFALPGGYVYITKGMLDILESDEEITAVLAHEIGHVVKKHGVQMYQRQVALRIIGGIIVLSTNASDAFSVGFDFVKALITNGYSREAERQADLCAVNYLRKAKCDPQVFLKVLYKVKDMEKHEIPDFLVYLRTHPPAEQRIKYVKEYIKTH